MNEKPIIFRTDMVQAILEGRKSVTRRIVKRPKGICDECWNASVPHNGEAAVLADGPYLKVPWCEHNDYSVGLRIDAPYAPGDVLWVRETFGYPWHHAQPKFFYKADDDPNDPLDRYADFDGWKPSIFMPRWASRLTLEVTDVRIERLQEITEEEAVREGVFATRLHSLKSLLIDGDESGFRTVSARENFAELWDQINGKRASWESNPWVWCIEFRRITT